MSEHFFNRAVIFTGGNVGAWAFAYLAPGDYLIGADRGAAFLIHHGYIPHLALGDFDSVDPAQRRQIASQAKELLAYDAIDKDWTDTELALNEAINRGYKEILLIGALGTRADHSLGNIQLLRLAHEQHCKLTLIDENNEIRLCTDSIRLEANPRFPYTSLLPLTLEVTGITLQGFRYPLNNATIRLGQSIGISNIIEASSGTVQMKTGILLIIRSRD